MKESEEFRKLSKQEKITVRFLEACEYLIKRKKYKNLATISKIITGNSKYLSDLKSRRLNINLENLERGVVELGINPDFIFYNYTDTVLLEGRADKCKNVSSIENNFSGLERVLSMKYADLFITEIFTKLSPELKDKVFEIYNCLVQDVDQCERDLKKCERKLRKKSEKIELLSDKIISRDDKIISLQNELLNNKN